jgi:DUF4097 and DUF4098 domain-containing protein YvlB
MKKIVIPFLLSIILLISCKGNDYSFVKEYKISTPANLQISTSGGSISASGQERTTVEVAFIVKKRGQLLQISLEELQKMADVVITIEDNMLQITVEKTFLENLSIGFEIKTPAKTSCILNTSGGSISINNLTGAQEVHTSGGSLDIENISGKVDAVTSGGSIETGNTKGDLTLKTSGGSIKVEKNEGSIEAHTSGGSIKINDTKFDVNASTSGGSINLNNAQGKIDVNTSGGGITLDNISGSVVAKTSGGGINANMLKLENQLVLKTSGGGIHATVPSNLGLDLNLSGNKVHTKLNNFSGSAEKDKIAGQMNGGGIRVDMSTSGGDVVLEYK